MIFARTSRRASSRSSAESPFPRKRVAHVANAVRTGCRSSSSSRCSSKASVAISRSRRERSLSARRATSPFPWPRSPSIARPMSSSYWSSRTPRKALANSVLPVRGAWTRTVSQRPGAPVARRNESARSRTSRTWCSSRGASASVLRSIFFSRARRASSPSFCRAPSLAHESEGRRSGTSSSASSRSMSARAAASSSSVLGVERIASSTSALWPAPMSAKSASEAAPRLAGSRRSWTRSGT